MDIKDLPSISTSDGHNILLLGNGINRLFSQKSCDDLIEDELKKNNIDIAYSQIKNMPFNMQIIVASNDNVNKAMNTVSKKLKLDISEEQREFLKSVLDIDCNSILTANYTTELEQAFDIKNNKYAFSKSQFFTKALTETMKKYRLYRYTLAGKKSIWHIHGDIYAPSSIIMGNYYYGKQISKIHQYLETFMKGYNFCKNRRIDYTPKSWVDYFMFSNVFILGFNMAFSENDIWYLIGAKKKEKMPGKIYFYIPKEECKENEQIILMLKAYGVEVIDKFSKEPYYKDFYNYAIEDIKSKCSRKNPLLSYN